MRPCRPRPNSTPRCRRRRKPPRSDRKPRAPRPRRSRRRRAPARRGRWRALGFGRAEIDIEQRHLGTGRRKCPCRGRSDGLTRAGDRGDLAGQRLARFPRRAWPAPAASTRRSNMSDSPNGAVFAGGLASPWRPPRMRRGRRRSVHQPCCDRAASFTASASSPNSLKLNACKPRAVAFKGSTSTALAASAFARSIWSCFG